MVVQVVDARDPLLYRCSDLEAYAAELHATKTSLLLLNKVRGGRGVLQQCAANGTVGWDGVWAGVLLGVCGCKSHGLGWVGLGWVGYPLCVGPCQLCVTKRAGSWKLEAGSCRHRGPFAGCPVL